MNFSDECEIDWHKREREREREGGREKRKYAKINSLTFKKNLT